MNTPLTNKKKKYKARWVRSGSSSFSLEKEVAIGELLKPFKVESLTKASSFYEEGAKVSIAKLAVSADGGWGRILNTNVWVSLKLFSKETFSYSTDAAKQDFEIKQNKYETALSLKPASRPDKLISVAANFKAATNKQEKTHNPKLALQNKEKSKKEIYMDKKELKTIIANLGKTHIGEEIELTFRSNSTNASGMYRLLETKVGRGKGGSMIARVENVSSGHTMSFGTPNSEEVLNIKWRGEDGNVNLSGYADESAVPAEFIHDSANAELLKLAFSTFIGLSNVSVTIEADETNFAGTHNLLSAKKMAGRFGQIKLELEREDGTKFEVWSYRHSGIVKSIR